MLTFEQKLICTAKFLHDAKNYLGEMYRKAYGDQIDECMKWINSMSGNKAHMEELETKSTIDKPFWVTDGEVIEKTILIPEGCSVVIEDNKIVIKKCMYG